MGTGTTALVPRRPWRASGAAAGAPDLCALQPKGILLTLGRALNK